MKKVLTKISKNLTRKVLLANCTALLFLCVTINNAAIAAVSCTTCDVVKEIGNVNTSINTNHDSLLTVLMSYFISGLQDKQNPTNNPLRMDLFDHYTTLSKIDIINADTRLANAVSTVSSNLASYYLAGIDSKQIEASTLGNISAEDSIGNPSKVTSYVNNVLNAKELNPATAMINMDTLLGPLQYDTNPSKGGGPSQQSNAQTLLRYLESLAPPPEVIRVSEKFTIPYTDPNINTPTMVIDLKKVAENKKTTLKEAVYKLQKDLNNNPIYGQYKTNYRSAIAVRTMLMNNLLRLYQERIAPTDPNKKSIATANYESATWRLNQQYRDDIQKASPATMSRESLLLLAEIHYDLYKIQQQNEQLIALQSLNNMQLGQLNSPMSSKTIKQVAKTIYCWYDKASKAEGAKLDPECTKPTLEQKTSTGGDLPGTPGAGGDNE